MASDAEMMDINDVRLQGFANYVNTPARLGRIADAPAQLAGHKRSRLDFEPPREIKDAPPRITIINPRRAPGSKPKEDHRARPPPVQRNIIKVGTFARDAAYLAGSGIKKAFQFIKRQLFTPRDYTQIIPTQYIASVDADHDNKRRAVSVMPGIYPNSPSRKNISSPKIPQHNTTAPLKEAEVGPNGGPTPPDSRPTSSSSEKPFSLNQNESAQLESLLRNLNDDRNAMKSHPSSAKKSPSLSPGSSADLPPPPPPKQVAQMEKKSPQQQQPMRRSYKQPQQPMRRSYKQPFSLEPHDPEQLLKSILKDPGKDRNVETDKRIDNLITRSRRVTVESPEAQAVRHTYRQRIQRKQFEDDRNYREMARLRDINEERLWREAEEKRIAEVRAFQAEKAKKAEKAEKGEKARLKKEAEDRKLKEDEEEIRRLKLADKQRQEERIREEAFVQQKIEELLEEQRQQDRLSRESAEQKISELQITTEPTTDDLITTLSSEWEGKIDQAMAVKNQKHSVVNTVDGAELSRKDFGTLLPQEGTHDNPTGWLNDEIVNGFMGAIVASKKEHTHYQKSKGAPAFESYPTGWLSTYKSKGINGIARWSKRKGIQGKALLNSERIYFPVNESAHWTLLIISPTERKIEYLDSLQSATRASKFFGIAREWLAMELKEAYNAEEWTDHLDSVSQRQRNMNDCGVFTCFNALANAKGLPYDIVDPGRMPDARRLLAAVLLKQGLNEDMNLE